MPDTLAPHPLADRIDALLPQTQCTKCGFDGCLPYAQAIAEQRAQINRCPPGGRAGVERLAALLGRPPLPLDPECGEERAHRVAWIDPELCIGCTKCIVACPLDAIIGAARRMHTVIGPLCSGCDLCVPVCPVDCITMREDPAHPRWSEEQAAAARVRYRAHLGRIERDAADRDARLQRKAEIKLDRLRIEAADEHTERKRAVIEAAIRRARERLAQR